ncbi:MAG TPA: MG2 domain-containing protein [Bryobacteraceae bacterium]|nr:MG2 domain-containing protein [Bryobacteraceae bacterium]
MKAPSKFWYFGLAILIAMAFLEAAGSPQATSAVTDDAPAVTYTHGAVHAAIPYKSTRAGAGRLTVEILDPDDQPVGRAVERVTVDRGKGQWQPDIKLSKALGIDELAWHRLRYRFAYDGDAKEAAIEGTESISQILRMPVVHILGQQSYLTGGEAAVRVIVADSGNRVIPGASTVRIELLPEGKKPRLLYTGRVNARGTAEAQFRFPAGTVGTYPLRYLAETPIGSAEFTQQVRLADKVSILLTTEKPIYQPGQTIHVRALALDRAHHEAAAARKLTLEVEDSRGNKVFKKAAQTDRFGIAAAEFELADEVNLGTYHLRALMGGEEGAQNTAEVALNVERYVLPKFKVAVEFSGKDNRAKRAYRPGDHVTGTVRANYFFGKAVDGAEVSLKATGMDAMEFEAASARGRTDPDGAYHFDLRLPDYFAGRPLSHGAARVLIEATVKDATSHAETRGEPITVSESPLLVTAVPEGGTLIPHLENQVFVLTSYPDGKPAVASLKIHAAGNADQSATTDEGGVAVIRIRASGAAEPLEIQASDKQGNHASSSVSLDVRGGEEQVLLRTERAVYRAGDHMVLRVFSTKKQGAAYVDVVKEGQTVLTRDVDIVNGQAELTLAVTPDLAGTVDISAYLFGRDARPIADHRLVFVEPADELKIEATADAPVHKPGDEARISFRVTNSRGEGVQAALGLQVVDQAVFALAEKQPGFAKVFFYLEQEAMQPRYEIHSIGMPEVVEQAPPAQAQQHDRAARALFAATELVNGNKFETEFGRSVPLTRYAAYSERYQERYRAQMRALAESLTRAYARDGGDLAKLAVRMAAAGSPEMRDAWGGSLRVEHIDWAPQSGYYMVRSAGPDKQFETGDDLTGFLQVHGRKMVGHRSSGASRIDVNVEHGRGPYNGLAQITGSVVDWQGGALDGATVRAFSGAATRSAFANADGRFTLAGLQPGDYHLTVSVGAETVSRRVTLAVRDRAVLTVMLRQEGNTSVVVAEPPRIARVFRGGIVGGVPGGVVGGAIADMMQDRRVFNQMAAAPAPAPMMAMALREPINMAGSTATLAKVEPAAPAVHVRSYFPEALYINPEIITDQNGAASITIPLADSITTWRMAMTASTAHGALGSGERSLKVFQDFFVDLDLPVTLTQGDRVSVPVAVYNYSAARGDVRLELKAEDWYALVDDAADKAVAVDSGRVGASQFTLEARRIGKFKLTLAAHMDSGNHPADIVVREIEVVPNGREQTTVFNGRLESAAGHQVKFPPMAIAEANKIFVRLYPGPLSQVIEGMDAILRMPYGCFEQTSSATYPNVLALDYMKRTRKLAPEVHAKAEGFIVNGYQRLLTFEVPGGGFSWFGNPPANKILTSYGLMEFSDMSRVHEVDPRLIERTQQWLAGQQQPDGSWKPDAGFINEGATNRFNSDVLRISAYVGWSLANTGYKGPAVDRAKDYVTQHLNGKVDAYTLAVAANFAADYRKDRDFTRQAMRMLLDAAAPRPAGNADQFWWTAEETGVFGRAESASVETTGLAVQALLKWGEASETASKALRYIAARKDSDGTWGTTQATIMALRALLLSTEKGAADVRGVVEISLDGQPVKKLVLTPENNDLLHQFVFPADAQGANRVDLRFEGKGGLAYQVVGRYFVPWGEKPASGPLSIDVAYDRTRLAQDDIATATATVKSNLRETARMVMVDLGIPPGFDLLSEDLQSYQEKSAGRKSGRMEKFTLTATQAILYFDSIGAGDTVTLKFRLRAKYPIRARTFQSRVYEYYNPAVGAVARPVALEVRKR